MPSNPQDTIAAISTPPGTGGLAVIRISGSRALEAIKPFFSAADKLVPRQATFGKLSHADLGDGVFDDCVVTYFKNPNSVTGEDLIELSIHGGSYLQQKLLEVLLCAPYVRPADPGEFTFRSFLNGKIDLSRAEAVADLIHAKDAAAHKNARHQLGGGLRRLVDSMASDLLAVITMIEAELDFSDQEIEMTPVESHLPVLSRLVSATTDLLHTYFYGRRLEDGFRVPLIGAPNSGKSSLFNLLLGEERAIVTPKAGTTRDTIEKTIIIAGHSITLIDTAGLRDTHSEAERSGVGRSKEEIELADLIIEVLSPDTEASPQKISGDTPHITVYNKLDVAKPEQNMDAISISCTTKEGLESLKNELYSHVINMSSRGVGGVVLSSERHRDVFNRFHEQLEASISAIKADLGPEYISSDLRLAMSVLGEISGETTPDDILNQIFSGFCVGK